MWTILTEIINHKRKEITQKSDYYKDLKNKHAQWKIQLSQKNFLEWIKKSKNQKNPNLIAEIKKASPSKWTIIKMADIEKIADIYESSWASAISILTDKKFFDWDISYIKKVSKRTKLPILWKEFILSPEQILELREADADWILLMVNVLKDVKVIQKLRELSESLNMHCLIETHSLDEIKIAIDAWAKIIGVNSRDFSDLSINRDNFMKLLPEIPNNCIKVAESWIEGYNDIEIIQDLCDAVLIWTSITKVGIIIIPWKIKELLWN